MKKMSMLLALLCFTAMSMSAETIYLNANGGCLDRMEYQLVQAGAEKTHTVFRYSPQTDTKLFLSVGTDSGNVLDKIPGRLKSCDKIQQWDLNTIRRINVGELNVFVVRQTPQGYTLQKVNSGAWMQQKGQEIEYVGSDMDFKANLGYINYGTPLSSSLSKSEVSMDNFAMFDCSSMISFRQSPNRSGIQQSTFQIVPELGITSLAFGWDASKATTKMQLKTINGRDYNAVLADACANGNANTRVVSNANTQGSARNSSSNADAVVYYEGSRGIPNSYNGATRTYTPGKPYDSSLPISNSGEYIPENAIYVGHIGLDGVERTNAPAKTVHIVAPQNTPKSYETTETAFIIAPQSEALAEVPVSYENAQPAIVVPTDVPTEFFTARSIESSPNPCGASAERGYHLVQKGETLYAISRKYNVSVGKVQAWNALQNTMIKPCMAIRVNENGAPNPAVVSNTPAPVPATKRAATPAVKKPATKPVPAPAPQETYTEKSVKGQGTDMKWLDQEAGHTVAAGETVTNLAARYGYTVERFRYINGFSGNETLRIGQQLRTTDCNCLRAPTPYEAEDAAIINYETEKVPTSYAAEDTKILTEKGVSNSNTFTAQAFIAKKSTVPSDYDVVSLAPEGSLVHVVQKEDTLFSLSKRYETTIDKILKLNGMDKGEIIIPAQRLYVK